MLTIFCTEQVTRRHFKSCSTMVVKFPSELHKPGLFCGRELQGFLSTKLMKKIETIFTMRNTILRVLKLSESQLLDNVGDSKTCFIVVSLSASQGAVVFSVIESSMEISKCRQSSTQTAQSKFNIQLSGQMQEEKLGASLPGEVGLRHSQTQPDFKTSSQYSANPDTDCKWLARVQTT